MTIRILNKDGMSYRGQVKFDRYSINDRYRMSLYNPIEGEITVFTINLPDRELEEDEVFIRDFGINEGYYEQLIRQGIVSTALETVYTEQGLPIRKCKLLIKTS